MVIVLGDKHFLKMMSKTIFTPFLKYTLFLYKGYFHICRLFNIQKKNTKIYFFYFCGTKCQELENCVVVGVNWMGCGGGGGQVALRVEVGICLYARGRLNFDYLRFGIRYSDAGIATRSYVTIYILTSRLSVRLWSCRCQLRVPSIVVTLQVCR